MEALNPSGNPAAGLGGGAAGGILKQWPPEGSRQRHAGIFRHDARQGQSGVVHHVVDGGAHGTEHFPIHPVDDEPHIRLSLQLQKLSHPGGIPDGSGAEAGDQQKTVGGGGNQTEAGTIWQSMMI